MTTIRDWIDTAISELSIAKSEGRLDEHCYPRREAEILLSNVLGKNSAYLRAFDEVLVREEQLEIVNQFLSRRVLGEPIAYIIGEKEFWSIPFKVSSATLIPRPDTEILVETALNKLEDGKFNILDLGTGTGAIAIALAVEKKQWNITGVDVNPDAVALANENKNRLKDLIHHPERVSFITSNWFSAFDPLAQNSAELDNKNYVINNLKFDMIVSNPPYIDENDVHLQQGDVRHEPSLALIARDNGFADINHIIEQSTFFLHQGGWLIIEHGWQQATEVQNIMNQYGFTKIESVRDLNGQMRVTLGSYCL
ncbi:peptide chain release factor N(5)-glutamine methyltransferase [Thorsellia anophelis]|uniref:Release factor glutamine methyltransferase n=1 Tax=Thorsellia anophelis DSM 18579 TaxID=1123402 RepID=A0A1I0EV69_9GAMM|nr:peptide chain release factor N(5)-glutamine methyltransferase [Thorsellia anophelis]SET49036.1 release factor glutamine methyltransferase [Thorsellia anophelis DSM 18579]